MEEGSGTIYIYIILILLPYMKLWLWPTVGALVNTCTTGGVVYHTTQVGQKVFVVYLDVHHLYGKVTLQSLYVIIH